MTPQEFFDSIDYKQLVFQKEILVNMIMSRSDHPHDEDMLGLVSMTDALQDTAAEIYGEEKVFLFNKKAQYLEKYKNYLMDNRLTDDSKTISTKDLFDFVDNEIILNEDDPDEDTKPLMQILYPFDQWLLNNEKVSQEDRETARELIFEYLSSTTV